MYAESMLDLPDCDVTDDAYPACLDVIFDELE